MSDTAPYEPPTANHSGPFRIQPRMCARVLVSLLFAAAVGGLHAQGVDPLKTPECAQALEQLQAARAAAKPQPATVDLTNWLPYLSLG